MSKGPHIESFASRLQVVYGSAPAEPTSEEEFARGYDDGRAEALTQTLFESRAAHQAVLTDFAAALKAQEDEIAAAHLAWLASMEQPIAALAVAIAAKVIGSELTSNSETVQTWVKQALSEIDNAASARIRINPIDSETLRPHMESLKAAASNLTSIEIVDDASLTAGCLIETDAGVIDARIDSMLAEALSALREAA